MHPDDRERFRSAVTEALATGSSFEVEVRTALTAKGWRWIQLQGSVARGLRGQRVSGLTRDVTARRRSAERERFLGGLTRTLAVAPDYEGMLSELARLAVPELGDWCWIDVVEDDGSIRSVVTQHSDPRRASWPESCAAASPSRPTTRTARRPWSRAAGRSSTRRSSEQLLRGGDADRRGARPLPAPRSLLGDRRAAAGSRPHDRRADADRGRDPAALRRGRPRLRRGGRAARGADDRQRPAARATSSRRAQEAEASALRMERLQSLTAGCRRLSRRRRSRRSSSTRAGTCSAPGPAGSACSTRTARSCACSPRAATARTSPRSTGASRCNAGLAVSEAVRLREAEVGRVGGGGRGSLPGVRRGGAGDGRRGACRRPAHVAPTARSGSWRCASTARAPSAPSRRR